MVEEHFTTPSKSTEKILFRPLRNEKKKTYQRLMYARVLDFFFSGGEWEILNFQLITTAPFDFNYSRRRWSSGRKINLYFSSPLMRTQKKKKKMKPNFEKKKTRLPTTGCIEFRHVKTPLSAFKRTECEGEGDVTCHLSRH